MTQDQRSLAGWKPIKLASIKNIQAGGVKDATIEGSTLQACIHVCLGEQGPI
jgi:hypothetical protein